MQRQQNSSPFVRVSSLLGNKWCKQTFTGLICLRSARWLDVFVGLLATLCHSDFLKLGRCKALVCVSRRIKRWVSQGVRSARQALTKDVNQTTVTCRKEQPVLSVRYFAQQRCWVVIRCFDICNYLGRHRRHDAALSKLRPSLKYIYIFQQTEFVFQLLRSL